MLSTKSPSLKQDLKLCPRVIIVNVPSPVSWNQLSLVWFCCKPPSRLFPCFQMKKFPFKLHWANTQDGPFTSDVLILWSVSLKKELHSMWEISSFSAECWHLFLALIGLEKSDLQTEMLLCMEKLLQEKCKTFLKYISHKVTAVFFPP